MSMANKSKDDPEKFHTFINHIAYIQIPLFIDLKSVWDIRCDGKLHYP